MERGHVFLSSLCAGLLTLLFTYSAVSKLLIFDDFRSQLHNQPVSPALAEFLLRALPFLELTACLLLLTRPTRWYGLLLSFTLMTAFSMYVALVLLGAWERIPCSCGGVLTALSWKGHFWFNLFFTGVSATGLAVTDRHNGS